MFRMVQRRVKKILAWAIAVGVVGVVNAIVDFVYLG